MAVCSLWSGTHSHSLGSSSRASYEAGLYCSKIKLILIGFADNVAAQTKHKTSCMYSRGWNISIRIILIKGSHNESANTGIYQAPPGLGDGKRVSNEENRQRRRCTRH